MSENMTILSIEKAVKILRLFSKKDPQLTLNDITKRIKMNKTTVYRLCYTLEQVGFLQKIVVSSSPYYRLGIELFNIGNIVVRNFNIFASVRPYMQSIAEELGDTVYLFIEQNLKGHCILMEEGSYIIRAFVTEVGDTIPLNVGGAPLAILAFMEPEKQEQVIHRFELSAAEETRLRKRLEDVARKGYASSVDEVYPGTAAIGAPILNHESKVIAAISAGGITSRFTEDRLPLIIQTIKETALQISMEMGYHEA